MNVRIITCFETWYTRLQFIEQFFRNRGDDVITYISDFDHPLKKRRTDFSHHINYEIIHLPAYKKNLSIRRMFSHYMFAKRSYDTLCREKHVDLIYAMLPANSVALFMKKYKNIHKGTRIIFDIYDMWPESMQFGNQLIKRLLGGFLKSWQNLRDKNLNCADYIFLECGLYKEKLGEHLINIPHDVIYASKNPSSFDVLLSIPEDRINLCYMGSINHIIDIDGIVKFIEKLKNISQLNFILLEMV